jgi:anti-sigma factor RsiW
MTWTHDELRELLGAYALDAVDEGERDAIDRHLLECPQCRAEVAEHREVAALLANSGADAPPGVWERISDSLEEPPPPLPLAPLVRRRRARSRWLPPAAIGIAAALLIAVLGVQVRHQDERIDQLSASVADPLRASYERALADPAAKVVELGGAENVRAVVTRDGAGYLLASSLPRLSAGRTYQLWGRVGADRVSLGVLGAHPELVPFRADRVSFLAVTDETAGGVVRSSRAPVVKGQVS